MLTNMTKCKETNVKVFHFLQFIIHLFHFLNFDEEKKNINRLVKVAQFSNFFKIFIINI